MQHMDPLPAVCPFCKTKAAYPLADLEKYQAVCTSCNKNLASVSRKMFQQKSAHDIDSWIGWLKLEIIEELDLIDSITDEEFDNTQTLVQFCNLLKSYQADISLEKLIQHPKLLRAKKLLDSQTIDSISFKDIASYVLTPPKFPFQQFALVNSRIFTGEHFLDEHAVVISEDIIDKIIPTHELTDGIFKIDLNGGILAPGFIDLQVNGGGGEFFTNNPGIFAINRMLDAHRSKGTTSLLPTLISESHKTHRQGINAVTTAIAAGLKGVLGIHIEGPFFAMEKRGAHAEKFIRVIDSSDVQWLIDSTQKSSLQILLTLAPEMLPEGIIKKLTQHGIKIFAGHTNASYEKIIKAINEGLHGFTHLYNAMTQMTARDPGVVGAALENKNTWCGIILDGHHVHPTSARIAHQLKKDKLFLVSDAMATVGSQSKTFPLYEETISESTNESTPKLINQEGKLAGSAIGLIDAVQYCTANLGIELAESLRMASLYPAQCMQLNHLLGKIQTGYRADLVHFTDDFQVQSTWVAGDWIVH